MEIDKEKQEQALAKAKSILADAERKREAVRVEQSVQQFLQGDYETLFNDELVENLASYMLNQYIFEDKQDTFEVLDKLGESLGLEKAGIRERSLMVLSVFAEIILEENFDELQEALSTMLVEWLQTEDEYIAGFELVCSQLQSIILKMLYNGQWGELENQITVLNRIARGEIEKNGLIRGVIAKLHENLAEPDILDLLVTAYLDENDDRDVIAENTLVHLGHFAALFLVHKMIYSTKKEERFALIELIPRVGQVSIPVLKQCLEDDPQWYVIRNIIMIISRLEDSELYPVAEIYLDHKDARVQQQVINCIELLDGPQMCKRLITAMMRVSDDLKGQVITLLAQCDNNEVGDALVDLLEKRNEIARSVRDDLAIKLCLKLKHYPSARAASCLADLISERRERYGDQDRVVVAAAGSIKAIETGDTGVAGNNEPDLPVDEITIEDDISVHSTEEQFNTLFSNDEMAEMSGGDDLDTESDSVGSSDGGSDVQQDEENALCCADRSQHTAVWNKLYELMTDDEADEFYALLKPLTYRSNEEIVARGENVTNMFFIDSGIAGLSHIDRKGEILLASIQTGELIGSEGLIQGLEWTISLSAQTDLQVRILEQESFNKLSEQFPDLSEKLRYFCNHYDVIPYLVSLTENDGISPVGSEIVTGGLAQISLAQDMSGADLDDACAGSLQHIARGGYCFILPIAHEGNAEIVLGRQVSTEVVLHDNTEKKCFGVVVGAGSCDQDEQQLIVYIKFYHPLEKAEYDCTRVNFM